MTDSGRRRRIACGVVACVLGIADAAVARAGVEVETFAAGDVVSFALDDVDPTARVAARGRVAADGAEDGRVERFEFATRRGGASVPLVIGRTPSQVFEEFAAEVRFRGDVSAVVFALRVRLPGKRDPRTGGPLVAWLRGPVVTPNGTWQTHRVEATKMRTREVLRRLRFAAADPAGLTEADMVIDGFVAEATLAVGGSYLEFDRLDYGPVVAVRTPRAETKAAPVAALPPDTPSRPEPRQTPRAELRLGQLRVDGRPFFPRIAPYHGEGAEAFARTGCNVAWVESLDDREAVAELTARGIAVTTTPRDAADAADAPPGVLFWSYGPRAGADRVDLLSGQIDAVRRSDPAFGRPVLIDVAGAERAYSRVADLLSSSRHMSHTAFAYDEYRDWLERKRRSGRPGVFFLTWVQTDPAEVTARRRAAAGHRPVVVEPEQLRAQVFAALSAGARGVGYWTHDRTASPADVERDLAMTLLNRELSLLEPWLAAADVRGRVPIHPSVRTPGTSGRRVRARGSGSELLSAVGGRSGPWAEHTRDAGHADLTILGAGEDRVAIANWYGEQMQFVPGQLAANDVSVVIPGVPESASVWRVSPAGVRSLAREWVPGGVRVTLPRFDRTAVLLITADQDRVRRLRREVEAGLPASATAAVRLARAKQRRVEATFAELSALRAAQPDGPQLLARADDAAAAAEAALGREDFAEAIERAGACRQLIRILQRADWRDAVRVTPQPLSSQHTLAHDAIPDHWRLIAAVGRTGPLGPGEANRLPSGTFESVAVMSTEGWEHRQNETAGVRAAAGVHPGGPDGGTILRLSAERVGGSAAVGRTDAASVVVRSPAVTLRAGQLVHATGLIRVGRPLDGHADGLTIHESIGGPAQALRWTNPGGWERFELFRQAYEPGPWQLTVTLHGVGEVSLDELRVATLSPAAEPTR
ncbi:MAG: hypothetical protein AAGJ97_02940, partial [Planctomycetota bacterium]